MPRVKDENQLGMDEELVEDEELEALLEAREKRKASLGAVNKEYKAAHELVIGALGRIELEDGTAARVGRFRIVKSAIPGRSVTFETKPSSRIRIGLVEDDDSPASEVAADEADLRPTGEVNADLLRGEADRASEPTQLRPGGRQAGRNAQRGPFPAPEPPQTH